MIIDYTSTKLTKGPLTDLQIFIVFDKSFDMSVEWVLMKMRFPIEDLLDPIAMGIEDAIEDKLEEDYD